MIGEAIQDQNGSACRAALRRHTRVGQAPAGEGARPPPGQQHHGRLWLPVGKMSAVVEHCQWADRRNPAAGRKRPPVPRGLEPPVWKCSTGFNLLSKCRDSRPRHSCRGRFSRVSPCLDTSEPWSLRTTTANEKEACLRASYAARREGEREVLYPCCCGLDVHKKSVTACLLWAQGKGRVRQQKRQFGTFTRDLLGLATGCASAG